MAASKQSASTNIGVGVRPNFSQRKDPALYGDLQNILNALRILQQALDLYTGAQSPDKDTWESVRPVTSVRIQNLQRVYAVAKTDIAIGRVLTFSNEFAGTFSSGTVEGRLFCEHATTSKFHAYAASEATAGDLVECVLGGIIPFYKDLVPGEEGYLLRGYTGYEGYITQNSSLAGSNPIVVGYALSNTAFYFIANPF